MPPSTHLLRGDGDGNYRIVIWQRRATLARRLAVALPQLQIMVVDELLWNDGWVETPHDEYAAKLRELALAHDSFVTDANALNVRDAFVPRATDILFAHRIRRITPYCAHSRPCAGLDWPRHITLWRLLKRTWRRLRTAEVLFGTTDVRETWRTKLFSRVSIIWWCLSRHRYLRRKLEQILAEEGVVRDRFTRRFTRPADLAAWVAAIEHEVKAV